MCPRNFSIRCALIFLFLQDDKTREMLLDGLLSPEPVQHLFEAAYSCATAKLCGNKSQRIILPL